MHQALSFQMLLKKNALPIHLGNRFARTVCPLCQVIYPPRAQLLPIVFNDHFTIAPKAERKKEERRKNRFHGLFLNATVSHFGH